MSASESRLRAALEDARDGLEEMLLYVPQYFVEKWELDGYLSRAIAALEVSDASKRGKSNRARGHSSERLVVDYLKSQGFVDATTTRNTGGAGGNQSGDVLFAPGAVLEVKYEQTARYPAWCRQAAQEAGVGRVPIVLRRVKGSPDVGMWPAVVPRKWWLKNSQLWEFPEGRVERMRGDFAKYLTADGTDPEYAAVTDETHVVTRFWRVAEAFRLDR